jgi:uncharacterized protein (TIGR03083 family)
MSDHGDAYRGCRARLTALAGELGDAGLATIVPTCPDWRIKDVYGHLIGLVADVGGGNTDGAGTDPWTAKQVDDRRDKTGAELIAEWDGNGPGMEELLDGVPPSVGERIVGDIATHELDVWGAVGRAEARDTDAVRLGFERYRSAFDERVASAGLTALDITGLASEFELFRALTGRRSADQIRAYAWTGDAEPYVAIFSAYGTPTEPVIE